MASDFFVNLSAFLYDQSEDDVRNRQFGHKKINFQQMGQIGQTSMKRAAWNLK
jgi:hypothetical protein